MTEIVEKLSDSDQYRKRRDVVSSDSGNKYRISIRKSDGRWVCSCRGWTNVCNKKGTDCKHIKELKHRYGPLFNDDGTSMVGEIKQTLQTLLSAKKVSDGWHAIQSKAEMALDFLTLMNDESKDEFEKVLTLVKQKVLQEMVG